MPRFRKEPSRRTLELTRPELVWTRVGEHSHGEGKERGQAGRQQHWRAVDVIAMILAALQVVLPIAAVILAGAGAAYLLFMLAFG